MNTLVSLAAVRRAIRSARRPQRVSSKKPAWPALPFPVFIAHSDVPAGRYALGHVKALLRGRNSDHDYQFQPMLWRFSQLNDPRWRDMALRDACQAAAVVLAMSEPAALCTGAETWLATLASQQRESCITALILIGEHEAWTISMQRTARQAAPAKRVPTAPECQVLAIAEKTVAACAA